MDRLRQDLRYSVRTLRTQPMFAVVAVLTLALGVGANAAIFSVCQAVLFKPLPYPEPDRLVMVWERVTRTGHAWWLRAGKLRRCAWSEQIV